MPIYAMGIILPVRNLAMGEIRRIHLQLSHCSGNTLRAVVKSAQMHASEELIRKVFAGRKCQMAVQRIDPSRGSRRAKYNGEAIALEIVSPFAERFGGKSGANTHHYSRLIRCPGM